MTGDYRRGCVGGFTLIEVLTVVVIMVILFSIVAFSAARARSSARDERRRADLAAIASGLERYRADCGVYPSVSAFNAVAAGGNLTGNGSTPTCVTGSVYIRQKPADPDPARAYSYNFVSSTAYTLCAALESPVTGMSGGCIGASTCGGAATPCNYIVRNL